MSAVGAASLRDDAKGVACPETTVRTRPAVIGSLRKHHQGPDEVRRAAVDWARWRWSGAGPLLNLQAYQWLYAHTIYFVASLRGHLLHEKTFIELSKLKLIKT
ncbi:hypothetical protein NDU88_003991 [Pleurodeles waltl]|uniref:Uncharacterized protein n=1 Tax=Pleurodeles waltl TaxID=8319 RepID=A0AAV7LIH4_PLEWA|nr:hypothetical protein NDU88_003991 [Pleurodeles waltl]